MDARVEADLFVQLLMVNVGVYLVAVCLIGRWKNRGGASFAVCVLLAIAWRVVVITGAPVASDDVYRYIWDGRVQQQGLNPYEVTPDSSSYEHLHDELSQKIAPASAVLPTVYPPGAQLFFRAVTKLDESVFAMVAAVVLCDLLVALVLWRWLLSTGRNPNWVLLYLFHPLVTIEGAGGGHIDIIGTLFVVIAAHALHQRRTLISSVALALAFSTKFLSLVLVPLLWRRVLMRDALVACGLVVVLYLPFTDRLLNFPSGSLAVYAAQWRFNGPFFAWIEYLLGIVPAVTVAVGSGLIVAIVARRWSSSDSPEAWAWPMATTLLFMPTVYPWYLVWLTPFLISRYTWPLLCWSCGILLTYVVWSSEASGLGWILPTWVEPLEYGLLATVALFVFWSKKKIK
tara:strand:+ start:4335 stop:5534 length:1200 start_codon:yes stop_codon:yes gene_type:complete